MYSSHVAKDQQRQKGGGQINGQKETQFFSGQWEQNTGIKLRASEEGGHWDVHTLQILTKW
jgi:hypothetical protein